MIFSWSCCCFSEITSSDNITSDVFFLVLVFFFPSPFILDFVNEIMGMILRVRDRYYINTIDFCFCFLEIHVFFS